MCARTIFRPQMANGEKVVFLTRKRGKWELKYFILKLAFRGFQNGKACEYRIIESKVTIFLKKLKF